MALFNRNVNFSDSPYQTPNPKDQIKNVKRGVLIGALVAAFLGGFFYTYQGENQALEQEFAKEKQKFVNQLNIKINNLKGDLSKIEEEVPFIGQSKIFNTEIKFVATTPKVEPQPSSPVKPETKTETPKYVIEDAPKTQTTKLSLEEQFNQAVKASGGLNTQIKHEAPSEEQMQDAVPLVDLPSRIVNKVPNFIYNSHNYSSDPKKRSITLNGQVLKEGSQYKNLTIVEIKQNYVEMRVDGQSFTQRSLEDFSR